MILNYDNNLTVLENVNSFIKDNELNNSYIQNFDIIDFIYSKNNITEINDYSLKFSNFQKNIKSLKENKSNHILKKYDINSTINFQHSNDLTSTNNFLEFVFFKDSCNIENIISLKIYKKENIIQKDLRISFKGNDNYHYFKKALDNCHNTQNIEDSVFSELFDYFLFIEQILYFLDNSIKKLNKYKFILENINFYKNIFKILKLNNHVKDINDIKNIIENNFVQYENMKIDKKYEINIVNYTINKKGELSLVNIPLIIFKNKDSEIIFNIFHYKNNEISEKELIYIFRNSLMFENKILKYIGQLEKRGLKVNNGIFNFKDFIQKYNLKYNSINF